MAHPEADVLEADLSTDRSGPGSVRGRVMRKVRSWLDEGLIEPGQPLPSERQIAARLQVNRKTVRRALSILDEQGLFRRLDTGVRIVEKSGDETPSQELIAQSIVLITQGGLSGTHNSRKREVSGWSIHLPLGILEAATSSGRSLVVYAIPQLDDAALAELISARPAGVLMSLDPPSPDREMKIVQAIHRAGISVVSFGPAVNGCDSVDSDHEAGGRMLMEWLLAQGRKRPVCLLPGKPGDHASWEDDRIRGYRQALESEGLGPLPVEWVQELPHADVDYDQFFELSARNLSSHLIGHLTGPDRADAVICVTDGAATQAIAACRLFDLEPHRDVMVVGYDNYWHGLREWKTGRVSPPPAATVDKQNAKIGHTMFSLLVDRIEGRLPDEPQQVKVEPRLVVTEQWWRAQSPRDAPPEEPK